MLLLAPYLLIVITGLTTFWFLYYAVPYAGADRAGGFLLSIFTGTAVLDVVLGQRRSGTWGWRWAKLAQSPAARFIPILAVLTVPVGVLAASITMANAPAIGWGVFVLCAAVVGVLTGAVGFIAAHELIHRRQVLDRAIGASMLAFCCYPCFFREHVHGHHQAVGTPDDPATARLGENVYRFLGRAVTGTVANAWRLERRLLGERGLDVWSPYNVTLVLWAASLGVMVSLGVAYSPIAAVFFLVQSAIAVMVLETINYVQHYGLVRGVTDDGELERVSSRHSFNAPFLFSNLTFLNLPLHSDHHRYPRRPFPILRLDPEAPVLPLPAFTMMVIAYLPPLWFALMNPRAEAANAR